jgi:signal transduction histidine kinase
MDAIKEKLLNDTYNLFMKIGLSSCEKEGIIDTIVAKDIMGFGSTIDEKIISQQNFRELLARQREQSQGIEINWKIKPFNHRISADENSAVFADEVFGTLTISNQIFKIYLRFSAVFEFQKGKWIVVHFHGSKPENIESEKDTFGIEEWKQKNTELEKLVAERTLQLTNQKKSLENALQELKATQSQLIQSEKMASLGELTAGIAHEIQNPLNFINNFSEVNNELIDEMNQEIEKKEFEEAKSIAIDIKQNLEKINHHGKRADDIVKGMLQHSKSSTGIKEPTDINILCDEYLRLAYHGLRAKDKSFNANFKTNFDESLKKINVIPQDFGRVILNLITNAFYTVAEKKKQLGENYEPYVTVSTDQQKDSVVVKVIDNGGGIPKKVMDKIFQPFFTTKPTGQGTGLGLSLSYDIITKSHGGVLKVESKQGQGSTFSIIIPNKLHLKSKKLINKK